MGDDAVTLDVLKLAWQSVVKEYTDQRAWQKENWFERTEEVWRKQRLGLPYPVIPPYPPEATVLERAQLLSTGVPDEKIKVFRLRTTGNLYNLSDANNNITPIKKKRPKKDS
jgi:hypothetical protein